MSHMKLSISLCCVVLCCVVLCCVVLTPDCHNSAWKINETKEENIFQLCRVLTKVFSTCSVSDQQNANSSCAVTSMGSSQGDSIGCASDCPSSDADNALEWCQYSAIYFVFCTSGSDAYLPPGTTLQDMEIAVYEMSATCRDAWDGVNGTHQGDDDGDHSLNSGMSNSGGSWIPIIGR